MFGSGAAVVGLISWRLECGEGQRRWLRLAGEFYGTTNSARY